MIEEETWTSCIETWFFSSWLCSPFSSFDNRAISLKFCGRACLIRNGVIILPLPHIITTFASVLHTSSQQLHKLARARVAVICVPCRGWALIHSPWGFFRPIFPTNPGNKKTQKLLWKTNPLLGCQTWCTGTGTNFITNASCITRRYLSLRFQIYLKVFTS